MAVPYGCNSVVTTAPPICGSVVVVLTTLGLSFATQIVVDPGSPSAEAISTFQAS